MAGSSCTRAARPRPDAPRRALKRQPGERCRLGVRLRLPLPESAGDDREKPPCPPGFVDRAYLVFFAAYFTRDVAARLLLHFESSCFHPSLDSGPRGPFAFSGVRAPGRILVHSRWSKSVGGSISGGTTRRWRCPRSRWPPEFRSLSPWRPPPETQSNRKLLLLLSPYPDIAFCILHAIVRSEACLRGKSLPGRALRRSPGLRAGYARRGRAFHCHLAAAGSVA